MRMKPTRREVVASLSATGALSTLGSRWSFADEPPPENTTIRLRKSSVICFAPLYVLEAFLLAEGFTDVQYTSVEIGTSIDWVERGDLDFDANFVGSIVHALGTGTKITTLSGLHAGCYELFAHESIHTISDLKGKRVAIHRPNSGMQIYISIMASHVGLNPTEDIEWVTSEGRRSLDMFVAGESDALLGFPPEPQTLRDRGFDRVILNTITDKPWSQYFCCVVYGNRTKVQEHPIATKRFLRAVYKAADFCTAEPEAAAEQMVEGGFTNRYDYALETIRAVQYRRWRDYDSEDSLRFYALQLHQAGMLKSSPNKLITEGSDWRFAKELKRELKI